jgi:hypothetical protein
VTNSFEMRRVAVGLGAAAVFTLVYLVAAPPTRRWVAEHVAAPVIAATAGPGLNVAPRASPPSVVVSTGSRALAAYSVPLGVLFFLPALLLLAVAPDRPYWMLFAAYLIAVGVLDLGVVAAGTAWGGGWFAFHQFLDGYVIRPTSIAVPLLFLDHHRRATARAATRQ